MAKAKAKAAEKAAASEEVAEEIQASEEVAEEIQAEVVVMPNNMEVCGINVFGCKLIHVKVLEILEDMFSREKDTKLVALFFSTTGPAGLYGEYLPDIKAAVINVSHCLNEAIRKVMRNDNLKLNVLHTAWTNILWAVAHELFHDVAWATEPEMADKHDMEDESHDYAGNMIEVLAREGDIEMPEVEKLGWLYDTLMETLVSMSANNEAFVKNQQAMIKDGLMFKGDNTECKTMKEYFVLTDDTKWDNATLKKSAPVIKERPEGEPAPTSTPVAGMDGSILDMMDQFEDDGQAPWDEGIPAGGNSGVAFVPPGPVAPPVTQPAPVYAPAGPPDAVFNTAPTQPFITTPETKPHVQTTHVAATGDVSMAAKQLYMHLYQHIFQVCGFANGDFANVDQIHQPINVAGLAITQMGVLTGFRSAQGGQFQWSPLGQGLMAGRTFKNSTLPGYDIEFTLNGQKHHFRFLPQTTSTASSMAQRARQGARIAYVIDADSNTYKARIIDGQYSLC